MDNHDYNFKEPWYLKFFVVIPLILLSMAIPGLAILLIPIYFMKSKKIKEHCINISNYSKEALEKMETESANIIENANIEANTIKINMQNHLVDLNAKIANKQSIIDETIKEATKQADFKLTDKKNELDYINAEIDKKSFYMDEINTLKDEINSLETKMTSRQDKIARLMSIQKSVNRAIKVYLKHAKTTTDDQIILPQNLISDIETLAPAITLKLHCMDYKDLRKAFRANNKLITDTLERYEDRYTTKTNKAIYQLMVIGLQAELQNVLYTLTYSKLQDGIISIKNVINKYLNIARDGSQTISSTLAKFIGEVEPFFIDAAKIEYEYYVKKEAAKQEQMALRAQMREEAEEQRRLKEEQEQIEKEESKYKSEIDNINQQLQNSNDDEKNQELLAKIKELEEQLKGVNTKKEDILNLQNGKAGYVYVISNLGSFGDDVFKIGMTRRLDPQERIDELGSASVPFKFDVHSFIFSKDAVKLESDLHAALDEKRLNKVNSRKEFFKVSIDELEELVNEYDSTAEFNTTMSAEQYRQSLSLLDKTNDTYDDEVTSA
ncbi:GIY-YIG nuclease family protein [Pectinatus haikarae]|uniref:Flagellar motor protein MotB n=1 Tax=Pectinatus haikarae TaxID=349096 RepID=A0ABT9YAW2_9FIRM|nr:GIY-YIG nuclease family protein [Pectinatus haikarae]MDQ0204968.1 flagellar motor protein MotB [Pectinatus haikarae]